MTFTDFVNSALNYYRRNIGGMRKGQAYYNYLHDVNPALANEINGTDADPFYNDGLVPYFLQVVESRWSATINA